MKIVIVNYRYFITGGPERYLFNISQLLEEQGHKVIPFSVAHNMNIETPYKKYFLSPIGSGDEVFFSDVQKKNKSFSSQWKGLTRMLYSFEAKKAFEKLLSVEKPDIVYVLHFHSKISSSIIDAAFNMGVPVIHRISDYSLLCPCDHYYRQSISEICELCTQKTIWSSVKNKCVYNSAIYSFIKALSLVVQKRIGIHNKIASFIFPSMFTMEKFIENGFDAQKCVHIPTLFNDKVLRKELNVEYKPFALFVGRTDPDKGIMTMLDAFIGTEFNLKIIGFSRTPGYSDKLKEYLISKKHNIEFLGKMDFDHIQEYLSTCLFTIVPSEWYDNLPNTILESYAMSKCVVATNIGSLTENVVHEKTGLLFNYKNAEDLRTKAAYLFENPEKAKEYGKFARIQIDTKFNAINHINTLMAQFKDLINKAA